MLQMPLSIKDIAADAALKRAQAPAALSAAGTMPTGWRRFPQTDRQVRVEGIQGCLDGVSGLCRCYPTLMRRPVLSLANAARFNGVGAFPSHASDNHLNRPPRSPMSVSTCPCQITMGASWAHSA
jgi:hypothetical protein